MTASTYSASIKCSNGTTRPLPADFCRYQVQHKTPESNRFGGFLIEAHHDLICKRKESKSPLLLFGCVVMVVIAARLHEMSEALPCVVITVRLHEESEAPG